VTTGSNTKTNYYAFGMPTPGRSYQSSNSYRYSFNGKENDLESGTQDYGFRIYNTVLGKFLSVDPLTKKYPFLTPYQFASNNPIAGTDMDGLEFRDPKFQLRQDYPVIMAIDDALTEKATQIWNFFTHDAFTPEPYKAAYKLFNEAADMSSYGTGGNTPSPTPGLDAIASSVKDNVVNGDTYSRTKFATSVTADVMLAYAGDKGFSKLSRMAKAAARTNLATQFYAKFGESNIASKLSGINFTKAVETITLESGTEIAQYLKLDGSKGKYFAPKGTPLETLGIDPALYQPEATIFKLEKSTKVLKSTAADYNGFNGGGTQYFSPELPMNTAPVTQ
jgi:RHS repeat-associated protein